MEEIIKKITEYVAPDYPWVAISEKMPQYGQKVIVAFADAAGAEYVEQARLFGVDGKPEFVLAAGDCIPLCACVYWMPMPEFP